MRIKKGIPPIISLKEHMVERTDIEKMIDTIRYVMKNQDASAYVVTLTISAAVEGDGDG